MNQGLIDANTGLSNRQNDLFELIDELILKLVEVEVRIQALENHIEQLNK